MSDRAAEFHAYIRHQESVLLQGIESIQSTDISLTTRQRTSNDLSITLSNLNARLADIARDLPNHDVKVYTGQIKEIKDRLATAQAGLAPKSKFSFKNKRSTAGTNSTNTLHQTEATATAPHFGEKEEYTSSNTRGEDTANLLKIQDLNNTYTSLPARLISSQTIAQQCIVTNLKSCLIDLSSPATTTLADQITTTALASLTITSSQKCLVLAPRVDGPVHVTGLSDCALFIHCRQLRMHDCSCVSVYLVCSSRPIIEDCEVIQFAPLPASSSLSSSLVGLFGVATNTPTPTATTENEVIQQQQPPTNLWNQVDDFKWLKPEPSPNWYAVDQQELDLKHRDRVKQIEAKIGILKQIHNEDEFATGIEEVLRTADFRSLTSAEPDKESLALENHH